MDLWYDFIINDNSYLPLLLLQPLIIIVEGPLWSKLIQNLDMMKYIQFPSITKMWQGLVNGIANFISNSKMDISVNKQIPEQAQPVQQVKTIMVPVVDKRSYQELNYNQHTGNLSYRSEKSERTTMVPVEVRQIASSGRIRKGWASTVSGQDRQKQRHLDFTLEVKRPPRQPMDSGQLSSHISSCSAKAYQDHWRQITQNADLGHMETAFNKFTRCVEDRSGMGEDDYSAKLELLNG